MVSKIILGERYSDPITGFVGIAVAATVYLYGCRRIGLQGPMAADGKIPEWQFFDELQLVEAKPDKTKGGPRPDPPQR